MSVRHDDGSVTMQSGAIDEVIEHSGGCLLTDTYPTVFFLITGKYEAAHAHPQDP